MPTRCWTGCIQTQDTFGNYLHQRWCQAKQTAAPQMSVKREEDSECTSHWFTPITQHLLQQWQYFQHIEHWDRGWKTDDRYVNPGAAKIVFNLCSPLQRCYCEKLHTSSSVYSKQELAEPDPKLICVGCSDPLTSNQAVGMFEAYAPRKEMWVFLPCIQRRSDKKCLHGLTFSMQSWWKMVS